MIIQADQLKSANATVMGNNTIDTTQFPSRLGGLPSQPPLSQLSRDNETTVEGGGMPGGIRSQMSSRNNNDALEGGGGSEQKSFRIRKYSRSISRSSSSSLHSARSSTKENDVNHNTDQ